MAAPFVVKQVIAAEGGDVHIVAAVVVVIADRYAHAMDFDIQAASSRNIGEGPVVIVAVKRRGGVPAPRSPVRPIDQQDVEPAVSIGIEEGAAGTQRLGLAISTRLAGVMKKVNAGGGGNVSEAHGFIGGPLRHH